MTDPDLLELVEMEVKVYAFHFNSNEKYLPFFQKDLLAKYDYDADKTPFVRGAALLALEGKKDNPLGVQSIFDLMDAIDNHIPTPVRPLDKPFLMAVEDIFTISGEL